MGDGDNLVDDLVSPIRGAQNIIEVDADYQALITDDIINCDGTFTVTFPIFPIAVKEITVTSTNGTITVASEVAIEGPVTLTTGTSQTFYPSRGQWFRK